MARATRRRPPRRRSRRTARGAAALQAQPGRARTAPGYLATLERTNLPTPAHAAFTPQPSPDRQNPADPAPRLFSTLSQRAPPFTSPLAQGPPPRVSQARRRQSVGKLGARAGCRRKRRSSMGFRFGACPFHGPRLFVLGERLSMVKEECALHGRAGFCAGIGSTFPETETCR